MDLYRASQRDAVALARAYTDNEWKAAGQLVGSMEHDEVMSLAIAASSLFGMAVQRIAHHLDRSTDDVFAMILAGIESGEIHELAEDGE